MEVFLGRRGAEKLGLGVEGAAGFGTGLEPDFAKAPILPVGEQADAVGRGFDDVELIFELIEGEIFVDVLTHGEFRLDIERDADDYAQSAETDDGALEGIGVLLAGELNDVARTRDQFKAGNRAGEITVFLAGTMSGGAAGTSDGYVRQGCEVMKSVALGVKERSELPVGNAGVNGDGVIFGVDRDELVQGTHGQQIVFAVGDFVEAVAGAKGLELAL